MRENLFVFVIAVGIIVAGATVTHISLQQSAPPPMDARVRLLSCDPDFFIGRKIKLPTEGMERINGLLVYRTQPNLAPILICNITPSDPLPPYIVGVFDRRPDGVMLLDRCYFSE